MDSQSSLSQNSDPNNCDSVDNEPDINLDNDSSSCWFFVTTIIVIFIGIMCGNFAKTIYNVTTTNDSSILNSDKVSWKIKLLDRSFKFVERLENWERRRQILGMTSSIGFREHIYHLWDDFLYLDTEFNLQETKTIVHARFYIPTNSKNLPIIVYFHGGGWADGSLEKDDGTCRHLSISLNAIVVSINYRLAPENPFPAAFIDGFEATKWVYSNAHYLHGNSNRIIIMGESAGANLAASITLENHKRGQRDFQLLHQVLINPATNLADTNTTSRRQYENGYILNGPALDKYIKIYSNGSNASLEDPRCSPFLFQGSIKGLTPAFVLTSDFDPLRTDGELYVKKLSYQGVNVRHKNYMDVHGFLNFFEGFVETPESRRAMRDIVEHLRNLFEPD